MKLSAPDLAERCHHPVPEGRQGPELDSLLQAGELNNMRCENPREDDSQPTSAHD